MRTPPFLLGVALLFWGWQAGFLMWAALMALVLILRPSGLTGGREFGWRRRAT